MFGKIFNKNKYAKVKDIFSVEINLERDWIILVITFVILLVISGGYSVYFYNNVKSGNFFGDETSVPAVTEKINLVNLDKTVLDYQKISDTFKSLKKVNLVDPSL